MGLSGAIFGGVTLFSDVDVTALANEVGCACGGCVGGTNACACTNDTLALRTGSQAQAHPGCMPPHHIQIRLMVQLPACGWMIMNTLITPTLVQQVTVAYVSSVCFTAAPVLASLQFNGNAAANTTLSWG